MIRTRISCPNRHGEVVLKYLFVVSALVFSFPGVAASILRDDEKKEEQQQKEEEQRKKDEKGKNERRVSSQEAKEFADAQSLRVYFEGSREQSVEKLLRDAKLEIKGLSRLDGYFLIKIPESKEKDDTKLVEKLAETLTKLRQDENVVKLTPDRPIKIDFGFRKRRAPMTSCVPCIPHVPEAPDSCRLKECRPNDPLFIKQWNMESIRAPRAWCGVRTSPIIVGVIDTGIDVEHADLKDNLWENPNPDAYPLSDKQIEEEINTVRMQIRDKKIHDALFAFFKSSLEVKGDKNGVAYENKPKNVQGKEYEDLDSGITASGDVLDFTSETDSKGQHISHGTQCAGIIGAVGNNRVGICGVCPNVKIMPIKVFHSSTIDTKDGKPKGYSDGILAGMIYARLHGAKIINLSFGGFSDNDDFKRRWVLSYLDQAGVLVVASAGNGKEVTKGKGDNVGVNTDFDPHFPSANRHHNLISVANLTPEGALDRSSNFGRTSVHIAAPGTGSITTFPHGHGTIERDYGEFGGTSAAAPHVAGAAALLWGHPKYASLNHHAIKAQLMDNARLLNSLIGKCRSEGTLDLSFICREHCLDCYPAPTGQPAPSSGAATVVGAADAATIAVSVPSDAKVYIDDTEMKSTGAQRTFVSPPLEKGRLFAYNFRVEVHTNDSVRRAVRAVQLRAGELVNLSFDLADLETVKAEVSQQLSQR